MQIEKILTQLDYLQNNLIDTQELLPLIAAEDDESGLRQLQDNISELIQLLEQLEFSRMFSGKLDRNNAYLEIQSGSGGTEAQDWAEMLMRMYLRWGDQHDFKTEVVDLSHGEVAGIKGVTIKFEGDYAYGWLRTENGVHRLVRKSPFDSNNKRHTSFAAVSITPEVDDDIEIEINPADLRIDTFRASGAGGQHVNRTDSAIRITHLPTNIVVQCQNDRSQHKNKAQAMSQLKAKLYDLEMQKKNAEQQALEATKSDIGWGSQIRSYVMHPYQMVKDLRTGFQSPSPVTVVSEETLDAAAPDHEMIFVDDASPDESAPALERIAGRDARVGRQARALRHEPGRRRVSRE